MSISLRIQWISLIAFTASSLVIRDRLVQLVPPEKYAIQSLLSQPFILFWLGWLLWFSFGPGRRAPQSPQWLYADPLIAWAAHIPLIGSLVLTWPYADEPTLILFSLFDMTLIIGFAMASIRPAPSRGFGSPVPLVLPAALVGFFIAHPSRYATVLALWMVMLGGVFVYARQVIERLLNQAHAANLKLAAERDARARFLASASHDLAHPLQAARMFFDQTQRATSPAMRDKAARNIGWAFDTTEALLRDISEYLRLEAGALEAKIALMALGPAIAQAAEMIEPAARLAGARLIAMPTSLGAFADPALVERILANLLGNALRHAKAQRILIGARRSGERVRLWVIDDGKGVAPADVVRLFDDYAQGSDHGGEQRGGFGLGLASVMRLAELMGGSCGIDRRWRKGSAFWVELPAA